MNTSEKRLDAAHTLVVPYDATPNQVLNAYERRLDQRAQLALDNDNIKSGIRALYDAKTLMSYSPRWQWLASLKVAYIDDCQRLFDAGITQLKMLKRKCPDPVSNLLMDQIINVTQKNSSCYSAWRALVEYKWFSVMGLANSLILLPVTHVTVPIIFFGASVLSAWCIAHVLEQNMQKYVNARQTLNDTLRNWANVSNRLDDTVRIKQQPQPQK